MAELNKAALTSENNSSFPNNNTGFITPTLLRTFNGNMIDSMVDEISYNADSASFSSSISQLKNFSSSLDATFATDAQLSASASTLQNEINLKVNTSSTSSMTVLSSSYAVTASFALNVPATASFAISASYALQALSASYAGNVPETASFAISASQASTASFALSASQAVTASFLLGLIESASFAQTASFLLGSIATASFALTASYAEIVNVIVEEIYTGEAITKGDPLYISGSQGAKAIVYKADAAVPSKMPVTYIASETIGAAEDSKGIVLGLIEGLDLTGYIAGDTIYVAEGGGYSTSRPTGSNSITQLLGVVTKGGNGGKGLVLNPGPATLPTLESGHLFIGNATNQPIPQTLSELGLATTGSNTFVGNQIISGNLLVTGSNINLEVDPPALGSPGTTNIKTVLDTTASAIVTSLDLTRQAAGPTGDLTAIRLQTFSGSSDTSGDRLLSRITTGVNRHTSLGLSGSVVNTQVNAVWATGSSAFTSQIVETASSGSATLSINVGNLASNNAAGTASIAAGLIRIGTNVAHTISSTGSFGPMILVAPLNSPALSIRSGSVEVTTPQGSGSFYSNLPITSSALRINGTAIIKDLIVSGTDGGIGSGSLFVENNTDIASISSSRGVSITGSLPTIRSGSLSGSLVGNLGSFYTASNAIRNIVNIGSASFNVITPNPNTLYLIEGSEPYVTTAQTSSFATTGSNVFKAGQTISGSVLGDVIALSISSNTASLDLSLGNFFTLQLVGGVATNINPTNIRPGQTVNIRLNTTGSGTVTFPSSVKQISGSAYTPTSATTGVDIITLISFDTTALYLANVKNLI
jgi:hypothetical protein